MLRKQFKGLFKKPFGAHAPRHSRPTVINPRVESQIVEYHEVVDAQPLQTIYAADIEIAPSSVPPVARETRKRRQAASAAKEQVEVLGSDDEESDVVVTGSVQRPISSTKARELRSSRRAWRKMKNQFVSRQGPSGSSSRTQTTKTVPDSVSDEEVQASDKEISEEEVQVSDLHISEEEVQAEFDEHTGKWTSFGDSVHETSFDKQGQQTFEEDFDKHCLDAFYGDDFVRTRPTVPDDVTAEEPPSLTPEEDYEARAAAYREEIEAELEELRRENEREETLQEMLLNIRRQRHADRIRKGKMPMPENVNDSVPTPPDSEEPDILRPEVFEAEEFLRQAHSERFYHATDERLYQFLASRVFVVEEKG